MNIFETFSVRLAAILTGLAEAGRLPAGLSLARVVVEPTKDPAHGDLAINAAMVLAKEAGMAPRALAELIVAELAKDGDVLKAEIAGPGFINLTLAAGCLHGDPESRRSLAGADYGRGVAEAGDPRSMSNTSRPIRPGRCMSATAAARCSAMRSPTCSPSLATT
jgi:arginyl-tRNA synthetase